MNDYQNFLEKEWIADLRRKSKIKVEKKQLKKLIKFYDNK
jgi:peptidyl-prolyl cis-trans isomerase SurA